MINLFYPLLFALCANAQEAEAPTPQTDDPLPSVSDFSYLYLCEHVLAYDKASNDVAKMQQDYGNLRVSEDQELRLIARILERSIGARAADLRATRAHIAGETDRLHRTYPDDVREVNISTCRTIVKDMNSVFSVKAE